MNTSPLLLLLAAILSSVTSSARGVDARPAVSGACNLITRQEATAALGAPVPAGSEKPMDFPIEGRTVKTQSCRFGSEVSITRFELGPTAATLFSQYRKSLATQHDYQSVKGVGDEAFLAKGQLAVRKSQVGLIVDVGQARGGGAAELSKEKALAKLAIGRL